MIKESLGSLAIWLGLVAGAQAATLEEIKARGSLRACFALIDPALVKVEPEGCDRDCQFSGLLVDQVSLFAGQLGDITVEPRVVRWSEQFENSYGVVDRAGTYVPKLLENGECDIYASNLARLPWRLSKMAIVPLFENRMIAIVRMDRMSEFGKLSDLAGKAMATTPNSSFHSWILERNKSEFQSNPVDILTNSIVDPLDMVRVRDADFTITDADIAVFVTKTYQSELSPAFAIGQLQKLGWGLHPENKSLNDAIVSFIETQKENSGSGLNQIWQQHLGVTLNEFEVLVNTLPGADRTGDDGSDGH